VTHPSAPESGALFTGDTLFTGGIGAFFEGNAAQMCRAMEICRGLPPSTCVYPGHEYTVNFIKFSQSVVGADDAFVASQLVKYENLVAAGEPSVPSTIAEELRQNMFMRVFDKDLQAKVGIADAVKLMQHLYDTCP
jgi:hydroxyacylglutathione hydrolase